MKVIHIGSGQKALDAIRETRQKLKSAFDQASTSASIGERKNLLAEICDLYDGYADRSGFGDHFTSGSVTDLDRRHHDAIEDLLFQLTCTPAGSRLVEAKLAAVFEKIEEHFRIREQRLLSNRRLTAERHKFPTLEHLLNSGAPKTALVPIT